MSAPYFYEQIDTVESHIIPGVMQKNGNLLSAYFRRYLAQRLFAIFDFKNVPETWDIEFLKYTLIIFGYAAVINTDKFGIIPQNCGIGGYNVFYRPTRAIICNPLFDRSYDLRIGEDCELIRISPDWKGFADLIGHHADLLALTVSSIISNLFNTKLSYVFSAESKAVAESFKAMFDKISSGNPAVFADKTLFHDDGSPNWTAFQQDLKSTYIVDLLQQAERTILNGFYADIGIPNVPYEKNERLTTNESEIYTYANMCLADSWLRTLKATTERVNRMFGLSITVDYNPALKEVLENGNGSPVDPIGDVGV